MDAPLNINNFPDSSYRTAVDNAVLKLAESGKLVELKNRWWKAPEGEGCVVSYNITCRNLFLVL